MKGLAMAANDMTATIKLALLIDGDNVSAAYMPIIMREASKLGSIAIRRIYGQFKSGKMKSWQKQIDDFNLTPVNVSPLIHGKNATDMKLVIEAMDIMNRRNLDGFCIASSDGDFTPLVSRIRSNALSVYGFGAKKAPAAYREEFERFYECDTLLAAEKKSASGVVQASATKPAAVQPTPVKQATAKIPAELREKILGIIEQTKGPDGLVHAGRLGQAIRQAIPNFRVKDYGSGTFVTLLRNLPGIDVRKKGNDTYVGVNLAQ
jgi:hypothetical protein